MPLDQIVWSSMVLAKVLWAGKVNLYPKYSYSYQAIFRVEEVQYNQIPTKWLVGFLKEWSSYPDHLPLIFPLPSLDQPEKHHKCLSPLHIPLILLGLLKCIL